MLIRVNGLDTYAALCGEGPPVVLLHGWGVSSESLQGVAEALVDRFRLVAIDLPGFGWSPPPPTAWGSAEYAAHVAALMDHLGVLVADVIGHSFGGRVALVLAARYPERVRRLVLVASAGIRPRRGFARAAKIWGIRWARRLLSLQVVRAVGGGLASRLAHRIGSRDYRTAGPLRATLVRVVNEDLRSLLPSIRSPVLIVWGDRDQEIPRASMELMARGLRRARLEVLEGAGHFPFLDMPDRFEALVRQFLGVEGA
jgi:pimeloyl-ACP methyl ester carboxylesterase